MRVTIAGLLLVAAACGPGPRPGDGEPGGGQDGYVSPFGDGGSGGDGGAAGAGCTAVDILFVIDNSASMCSYQDALAAAFPAFVDAIDQALPAGTDVHVAITTSSFCQGGVHSESNCQAQEPAAAIDATFVSPLEGNVTGNGYQGRLLEWEGQRFFAADTGDDAGRAALSAWFSGAARSVGCSGCSFDFTVPAAGWALDPANASDNGGFLRDEGAVLLLFILSDEADHAPGGPAQHHDQIARAKAACGGDACVVTGGLLTEFCAESASPATSLWTFLNSFGEAPVWGSIQGPGFPLTAPSPADYAGVVGDALAGVISQACEEIMLD